MIVLNIRSTVLRFDFSFFAVMAIFFFFDKDGTGAVSLLTCGLHELGHLVAMLICGAPLNGILFYGAGIRISFELRRCTAPRRLMIYAAGCAVNFILAAFAYLMGAYLFSAVNLITGIFNLLPLGELDGAAILAVISEKYGRAALLLGIVRAVTFSVLAGGITVLFLVSGEIGVTFFLTMTYLLILMILSG